jgi:hypothetical protein
MPRDRIDEATRRRTGFTAGLAVTLADGQEWIFPVPRLRVTPRRSGAGFVARVNRAGLPDYEGWVAVIVGDIPVDPEEAWSIRMTAAATLLLSNYELSDDELAELLVWESDDAASQERWEQITDAILGVVPKAGSATTP